MQVPKETIKIEPKQKITVRPVIPKLAIKTDDLDLAPPMKKSLTTRALIKPTKITQNLKIGTPKIAISKNEIPKNSVQKIATPRIQSKLQPKPLIKPSSTKNLGLKSKIATPSSQITTPRKPILQAKTPRTKVNKIIECSQQIKV